MPERSENKPARAHNTSGVDRRRVEVSSASHCVSSTVALPVFGGL